MLYNVDIDCEKDSVLHVLTMATSKILNSGLGIQESLLFSG